MGRSLSGKKKVAVLGAGKMGSILLQSFLRDGLLSPGQTWATVAHPERARMLKEKLKVHAGTDNSEAVKEADIVFLCVKPQVVADVAREIRAHVHAKQLVISVAASVPTEMIERALEKEVPVVRANDGAVQGKVCNQTASGSGDEVFRCGGTDGPRGRKTYGRSHRIVGKRTGLYLHHFGIAGRGGREGRAAARCGDALGGSNNNGRSARGARDRGSSGAAKGCGDDSGGMHN